MSTANLCLDSKSTIALDDDVVRVLCARHMPPSLRLDAWPAHPDPTLTSPVFAVCRALRTAIADGPGFVVVQFPAAGLDDDELCSAAWNLFTAWCRPIPQYKTGELIYPVEVSPSANGSSHYSMSNATGGFHTDGTLLPQPPEIAALLGLSAAERGGETVLMDGESLCAQLQTLGARHVEALSRAHHVDLMEQQDGTATRQQPIVARTERGLLLRYLRYYIERGYEKQGVPLPSDACAAMDALDQLASREENQVATRLERGDFLIWDNHRFLHGRRAFAEGASRRRLRRLYGMYSDVPLAIV